MRALQGHPDQDVSSTVTKRNPRPRKYASASERQAAYRARAPEVCFRAEGKTVDTLDKIAADLDVSRADLLLSMTKFALTNHDWGRFGLTHRPLPYQYGVEQEARTNPAPIWDRPRPKKLGPSVPLTAEQKRKAKALAAAAGRSYPNLVDNIAATRNPMKTEILERAKLPNGTLVRLQKRGNAYDVITNSTGITWRYLEKGVSEQRARSAFDLYTMQRKENPMKQPTPAQIAARERFAEMARSGAFKRKAKRKKNPASKFSVGDEVKFAPAVVKRMGDARTKNMRGTIVEIMSAGKVALVDTHGTFVSEEGSSVRGIPTANLVLDVKRNPAKKTVSQKISQLVHEGYPQKQAVAVALSEQRKGKVKRNPAPAIRIGDYVRSYDFPGMRDDYYLEGVVTELRPHTYVIDVTRRVVEGVEKRIPASLKQVEAPRGKGHFSNVYGVQKIAQRNPATGHKGSRTKLNPVKYRDIAKGVAPARVQYAVHMPDRPSYHAMAYFTKKADALEAAQEVSDRTGKPVAVSRVQVHFGPM